MRRVEPPTAPMKPRDITANKHPYARDENTLSSSGSFGSTRRSSRQERFPESKAHFCDADA